MFCVCTSSETKRNRQKKGAPQEKKSQIWAILGVFRDETGIRAMDMAFGNALFRDDGSFGLGDGERETRDAESG
jgi:hypothetical protein